MSKQSFLGLTLAQIQDVRSAHKTWQLCWVSVHRFTCNVWKSFKIVQNLVGNIWKYLPCLQNRSTEFSFFAFVCLFSLPVDIRNVKQCNNANSKIYFKCAIFPFFKHIFKSLNTYKDSVSNLFYLWSLSKTRPFLNGFKANKPNSNPVILSPNDWFILFNSLHSSSADSR